MKDKIQIVVAVMILLCGVAAFYVLSDKPMIMRIGAMMGIAVVAGLVGWFSAPGREFAQFGREAVDEAKKVVWPTRKEAMQSTGIIFIFVFIMAIFLFPTLKEVISNPALQAGGDHPEVVFPLLADVMDKMVPALAVSMVFFVPFTWFIILLLAIAFKRFRARQLENQPLTQAK